MFLIIYTVGENVRQDSGLSYNVIFSDSFVKQTFEKSTWNTFMHNRALPTLLENLKLSTNARFYKGFINLPRLIDWSYLGYNFHQIQAI